MIKWLFLLIGLATGGTGGFFTGMKYGQKVLAERTEQNLKSPEPAPAFTRMDIDSWDRAIEESFAEAEHPEEEVPEDIEVPDLPFEAPEDEEEEEPEDRFNPFYEAPRTELISEDQYLEEYNAYGKDTLYYYAEVDELTFSDEDRIDDKMGTVGPIASQFFHDNGSIATETVYVRNNRLGIDFMVELKNGAPYWYESE